MKNLILQYSDFKPGHRWSFTDAPYPKHECVWELSFQSIKKYAEKYKVDYLLLDSGAPHTGYYAPFIPFLDDFYKQYDNICFIDADILATINSNNIFEDKYTNLQLLNIHKSACGPMRVDPFGVIADWQNVDEINSGTVLMPKLIHNLLKSSIENRLEADVGWAHGGWDQEIFWEFAEKYGYNDLHYKYNYMLTYYDHRYRFDQTFIHYHWNMKHILEVDFESELILK